MQTIKIRRTNYLDIAFNPHGCKKVIKSALPQSEEIEIEEIIRHLSAFYAKQSEFDTRSEDSLLKRSIAKQQLTYAIFENSNDVIQLDTIIIGKDRNWPRYTDVAIKGFKNKDFNFTTIDSTIDLLMSHKAAYFYMNAVIKPDPMYDFITRPQKVSQSQIMQPIEFDLAKIEPIIDIAKRLHGIELNNTDYVVLLKQLRSIGLSDCVYYALHNEKGKIKEMMAMKLDQMKMDLVIKNNSYQTLKIYSEFNLVKKIIEQELDNPGKYLTIIHKNKVSTATQFYGLITAKDKEKILKLVGDRLKKIHAKPCVHNEPLDEFLSLYKITSEWSKEKRDKVKAKLAKFLEYDKTSKQHYCNKCGERVICDHSFELAGKEYKDKVVLVEKYRDPEDSSKKYTYCKYCSEKIFRNELEEIMTEVKFEEIVRSRQQTLQGDTQAAVFENGLYFGVSNAVSSLKFDYEFGQRTFVKGIMNLIFNLVYAQVAKLRLETDLDSYERMAGLYGYLYTAIYLMPMFISDPKVTTPEKTPKNKDAYAKYFLVKSNQRFYGLSTPENTKRIIYQAFLDLKKFAEPTISVKDEDSKILDIIQNPLYLILYRMHLCANPKDSPLDALKKIVTKQKPTVTTFHLEAKVPTKNVSQRMIDLYTYLMDYTSPYCYIFELGIRPTGASNQVYDPKLYNMFLEEDKKTTQQIFVNSYVKLIKSTPTRIFSVCYGANYLYDDEGDLINWNEGQQWKTKSGKVIKLSDIKKHVDETTDAKIEKRNKVIGFYERKFKHRGLPRYSYVKLDSPPTYVPDKKILGFISKINNKYSPNILEYLGRSTGYDYNDLIRGVIPNIENHLTGSCKLKYYIQLFIEQYYCLKYEPMGEENIKIIEESKVEFSKLEQESSALPDLLQADYYKQVDNLMNLWSPQLVYEWLVEQFVKFIMKANVEPLGKIFVEHYLKFMINTEKRLSLPNPKKLAGGLVLDQNEETEYDEAEDAKGEVGIMDEIDFEQDEDDINDD